MTDLDRIKELIQYLNNMTALYDAGNPEISDKEWDAAYFELKELEDKTHIIYNDSPTQKVSYEVVSELEKVEHNHKMLSLDKTKDWNEFLGYFSDEDVIGMVKLDGLTCSLEYIDGALVGAETRGNGLIGENIFHNALVINSIPKVIPYTEHLIVDGEVICTFNDFKDFSNEYANPRNFASGSIRLLDSRECAKRKLTFVVWNIIEGFDSENSFLQKLINVEKLGFEVVPYTSSLDLDARDFLRETAYKLGYPIDGLVGRFDDILFGNSLGETSHHTRAAFAFKFYDEEYESTLLDIEWTMGRTGVLTPVAIFDPINDGESVIQRASLHNLSIMYQTLSKPFTGQKIKVIKANQIIPQITWGEEGDIENIFPPKVCPICGQVLETVESDSGTENLICSNSECSGKIINRLNHFCGKTGFDIKGLSIATLNKLIDLGWIEKVSDIFNLKNHRPEWVMEPGFGDKSVDNILEAIEKSKEVSFENFLASLSIPLIGLNAAKELVKHIKDYPEFRQKIKDRFDFSIYDGFAESKMDAILNFDYSEADTIYPLLKIKDRNEGEVLQTLSKITVVITGKLNIYKNRAELQKDIEAVGGRVTGSVSKNTDYLINNNTTSTSSKNVAAKELGVTIISERDFIEKFLKNLDLK